MVEVPAPQIQHPWPAEVVTPLVQPYLERFGNVLTSAWKQYQHLRDTPNSALPTASASSRGMLISDFTLTPAYSEFSDVEGAWVDTRYGRPWVNVAGGSVQIRFRKLDRDMRVNKGDSDRALQLAYHLGDPFLDDVFEATVLTAGYLLDPSETMIETLALACHVGNDPVYVINLPGGSVPARQPRQLPLTPLSPPLIRSARTDIAQRLARKQAASE